MFKRFLILSFIAVSIQKATAQTLGGNAIFNFVNQANAAQLSALGGINVSNISGDVGMAFQNPALLRSDMDAHANASFNSFLAGIKNFSLTTAYQVETYNTTMGIGVNFFDYGNLPQTDASGNVMGSFHPTDYVVQLMASRRHKENWFYGATLKFINSGYGQYKSNGIAADVGISFYDTVNHIQASVVVKNIGSQLKTYDGSNVKEELPFDLQAGITRRLNKAPIQFSLTAHHLHRFNIRYNDTLFLAEEGVDGFGGKKFTFDKIISHLVFATQIFIKDKIEVTAGYNFLRRKDLNVLNSASGLNGFTMGAGLLLKQFQIRYTTGYYQQNMFNQLGVNFSWK